MLKISKTINQKETNRREAKNMNMRKVKNDNRKVKEK